MLVTRIQNRTDTAKQLSNPPIRHNCKGNSQFNSDAIRPAQTVTLPFVADAKTFVNISFRSGFMEGEREEADRFHWVAAFNKPEDIQKMLDNGTDVNIQDPSGSTALIWAVGKSKEANVRFLLSRPDIDVNIRESEGTSALSRAAYEGDPNVVKLLLAHPDIDVNILDAKGCTPLIFACGFNDDDSITRELLKQENINVNAQDDFGRTALMEAAGSFRSRKLVTALLEHPDIDVNLKDNKGRTAYDIAIICENTEAAEKIKNYQRGIDRREGRILPSLSMNIDKLSPEKNIWTEEKITRYFTGLVKERDYEKAKEVLNRTPLVKLEGNEKLLEKICTTGNYDFIETVFDYKINKQGQMRKEYESKRKEYFDKNLRILSYEELKQNPMVINTLDGFSLLMEKEEFNPNDKIEEKTLFEIACGLDSSGAGAKPILDKYEGVETERAKKSCGEKIKEMINEYETLGKYKLKLDKIKTGLVLSATRQNAYEQLKEFINSEEFKPEMTDTMGNSLLHIVSTATEDDARGLIQKLIGKGVDVNSKNITGQNPIMTAITALRAAKDEDTKSRLLSNIKFLIDKGVNIEEQDKNGQTVFHYVCATTSIALLTMILKKEPNVLIRDNHGNRPYFYIKMPEMKEIYMNHVTK